MLVIEEVVKVDAFFLSMFFMDSESYIYIVRDDETGEVFKENSDFPPEKYVFTKNASAREWDPYYVMGESVDMTVCDTGFGGNMLADMRVKRLSSRS